MKQSAIITSKTIREQVTDILRQEIIEASIKPGEMLSEREIAARLGVSTMPVKEAFRVLESEGLITSLPRRGSMVSEFATQSLCEVSFIRATLEGLAARFAVPHLKQEDLDRLNEGLSRANNYLNAGDLDGAVSINTDFHGVIRAGCTNKYLLQQINSLNAFEQPFRYKALRDLEERRLGYKEHRSILDAVMRRDEEKTERLMRNHILRSALYVLDRMQDITQGKSHA